MTAETLYDKRFYEGLAQDSLGSARVYLGYLFDLWKPGSVVDFGCGRGAWLAAAGEYGVNRLVGIDGAWNSGEAMVSPAIEFHAADLDGEVSLPENFDLALSLEVAEHVRPESSDRFVASLARLSDAVLFGAAFTGQPGTNHINTRPHSFWAEKFLARGYKLFDIFRPRFWSDDRVGPWYRQNSFLYVQPGHSLYSVLIEAGHRSEHEDVRFIDGVHPWLYLAALDEIEQLRAQLAGGAARAQAPSRNDACPCGSGKKYKRCHGLG
ncbi:MAG: SEC-C metal-binding domain-containing protein [Burkholderiales bacterium]